MAAPEWQGSGPTPVGAAPVPGRPVPGRPVAGGPAAPFPVPAASSQAYRGEGLGNRARLMVQASELTSIAKGLVVKCADFLDPALLAQLDAALARELADRSEARASEAAARVGTAVREGRTAAALDGLARRASAAKAAATKATAFAAKAAGVALALEDPFRDSDECCSDLVDGVDAAGLVDLIEQLETAKNALTGVQAKAQAVFAAQQRLAQAKAGMAKDKLGKGVGLQIGLARGESAHRGRQLAELAAVLVREMPHTLNALASGAVGEYRTQIMATETVFLSSEHRADVDRALASDLEKFAAMGSKELAAAARNAAYLLEPEVFTKRRGKAVTDRHVTLRPAADGMTLLSALIPLRHGVAVLKTLTQVADSARAAGDQRGVGQLMADALTHRLLQHQPCDEGAGAAGDHKGPATAVSGAAAVGAPGSAAGRAHGTGPVGAVGDSANDGGAMVGGALLDSTGGRCTTITEPGIMLELVMTDRSLFDGANDPAVLTSHDPIPAPEARSMVLGSGPSPGSGTSPGAGSNSSHSSGPGQPAAAQVWVRRLYTHPETGALLAMGSRARFFPEGMKEFLRLQYQRCATPYCDAPIREYDHIKSWASGGTTTIANGQGLCASCNKSKEAPGWSAEVVKGGPVVPRTTFTTPAGRRYTAIAPMLPGGPGLLGSPPPSGEPPDPP